MSAQIACAFIRKVSIHSHMDMLLSAKSHHPKQSEIQRFGLQFCTTMIHEDEISKFFCSQSTHA